MRLNEIWTEIVDRTEYSVHTLPKVEMAGGRDPLKPSVLVRDDKRHVAFLCAAEL